MGKGPGLQLRSRLGSFGGQGQEHLDRVLQGHPLNCAVEVIVPFTTVDETTAVQPRGTPSYYTAALALPQLLDPVFVDLHLRRTGGRQTCAVTHGTPMDTSDAWAVTPDGVLHLSLRDVAYQRLGIQGTACAPPRSGSKLERRYSCRVALTSPRFRPGMPAYDRILQCLRDHAAGATHMLVAATDADGCSATIDFPSSACAQRTAMQPQTWTVTNICLPPLDAVLGGDDVAAAAAAASPALVRFVTAWLGGIVTGAVGHVTPGAGIGRPQAGGGAAASGGEPPHAMFDWDSSAGSQNWPQAHSAAWLQRHRWDGLLTPGHVSHAVRTVREAVASRGAPWAAVVVTGFRDSPVAWDSGKPRRAGDDIYMVVILPKDRWWLLDMAAESS